MISEWIFKYSWQDFHGNKNHKNQRFIEGFILVWKYEKVKRRKEEINVGVYKGYGGNLDSLT